MKIKRKNPFIAALLCVIFGPLGYAYLGWRYAITALAAFTFFTVVLVATNLPIPTWMEFASIGVLVWNAIQISSAYNKTISGEGEDVVGLNTFPVAAIAMSGLLKDLGIAYAAGIGLHLTVEFILQGNVIKGLLVLLIGTPILVWIAGFVFGLISLGIHLLFRRGRETLFNA